MTELNIKTCPVCGVKIEGKDKVLFSSGSSGTRARLWARVCNYVQQPSCINKDQVSVDMVTESDYYRPI